MRLVFLILLMGTQTAFCQYTLRGKVVDHTLKTPVTGAHVYLLFEDYAHADTLKDITLYGKDTIYISPDYVKIDSLVTDSTGRFVFKVEKNNRYSVDAEYVIDSVHRHGSFAVERNLLAKNVLRSPVILELQIYCEYHNYINQDWCPVCCMKDECIPVEYGLRVPSLDEPIEELFDICKWKVYNAGCVHNRYCEARLYCRRCQKLF